MQPILSDSEKAKIHKRELEAQKNNDLIHREYHARNKLRRELVEKFGLDSDQIAEFIKQKSLELGIDQREVFNQVVINLSAVVQERLDATRNLLWPVITRHC